MGRWSHYLPIHDGSFLVLIRCSRSFGRLLIDKYLVNIRPIETYAFVHKPLARCAKKKKKTTLNEKLLNLILDKYNTTHKFKSNKTKKYQLNKYLKIKY